MKNLYEATLDSMGPDPIAQQIHEVESYLRNSDHYDSEWLEWLMQAEQSTCPHHRMEVDGFAGPEGAEEEFRCLDCGWTHHIIYF